MKRLWFIIISVLLFAAWSAAQNGPEALSPEEMVRASQIYFDRCSGCHGATRKGATGPSLEPEQFTVKGPEYLKAVIWGGLPGGMPDWGRQGVLTDEDIALMTSYLQSPVEAPPQLSFGDIQETWKLIKAPEDRPATPQTEREWQDYIGVILRDVGKVAILDGDSKDLITILDTGFATHILRSSKSGRYFMAIGRDGKASLIDLWPQVPEVVAEVRPCLDARSIESSKYEGFEDSLAIVGCYWPSHFVVLDGLTLEPIKVVSTVSYAKGVGERIDEARVAAIVASEFFPEWIVNIKEAGQTWLVDYSSVMEPGRPLKITMIDTELYLHDGGWAMGRYFIVAANAVNKLIVIDTKTRQVAAEIEAGTRPHPGRGANWVHPELGPLWATGNIGSPEMTVVAVDPENYPENAWQVVERIEMPYTGTLFIKTHPKSPWVISDFTVSPNPEGAASLCAIDKESLEVNSCWQVPGAAEVNARMVHTEFNKAGTEFWVSAWAPLDKQSFIVVYDAQTLEEKTRISGEWAITPTGKFNVYNTANDIY